MVAWGNAATLHARIGELVTAGADHVAVIPLGGDGTTENPAVLEALASA